MYLLSPTASGPGGGGGFLIVGVPCRAFQGPQYLVARRGRSSVLIKSKVEASSEIENFSKHASALHPLS